MAQAPDPVGFVRTADARRNSAVGNALCVGSMMLWAAGFPAAEILLETWSTLALITARLLFAVVFLLIIWMTVEGPHAVARAQWRRGIVVGGLGFGLGTWLLLKAQALTDPVTVAIFAATAPVAAAIVEMLIDKRRATRGFVFGIIAAVIGGIIASGGGNVTSFGLGALAVFASSMLFAWGSYTAVRTFPELTHLGRATVTLAGGFLFCGTIFCAAVYTGFDRVPAASIDGRQMMMLAIYALAGMALSQLLWISSVGRLGVALASFHMNVAPFYVMVIMVILGSVWNWPQAIGAGIVAIGVLLAQR